MKPVLGLCITAPFVGEFLLGNLTPADLWLFPWFMLLYGSGAVLIREIARRRPSPWAVIPVLGCAYALIEEGPVDQLLWNPGYAGIDLVHTDTYVGFLGTNVNLILTVLALHGVWSISVSIALIESLMTDGRRTAPWLGTRGLVVVGLLFVLGCTLTWAGNYGEYHFTATPFQLAYASAAIALLIYAAFRINVRSTGSWSPSLPKVFAAAFFLTGAWWFPQVLWPSQPSWFEYISIAIWLIAVPTAVFLSLRLAWTPPRKLAAAAGAATTYALGAFWVAPEQSSSLAPIGNAASAVIFAVLCIVASRAVIRDLGD